MSDLVTRMREHLEHARAHRMLATPVDLADLEALLTNLRDAESYVARLHVPLLWEFGTTDPDLLLDLFRDRVTLEPVT